MEYTIVDNFQIALTGGVDTIDASGRGGTSIIVKSAASNAILYIGAATNEAGAALSSTTGFALAATESVSLDLTLGGDVTAARKLSVIGTATNRVHVLVLKP